MAALDAFLELLTCTSLSRNCLFFAWLSVSPALEWSPRSERLILILQVTQHAVGEQDEETAVVAFETFLDLLEVPASWMGAFFPALVKLSVDTAADTQLELNTREQALQVCR